VAKRVKIKFLGGLAAAIGSDEIEVLVYENETVEELFKNLVETYPQLEPLIRDGLGEWSVIVVCEGKILEPKNIISSCKEVVVSPLSSGG